MQHRILCVANNTINLGFYGTLRPSSGYFNLLVFFNSWGNPSCAKQINILFVSLACKFCLKQDLYLVRHGSNANPKILQRKCACINIQTDFALCSSNTGFNLKPCRAQCVFVIYATNITTLRLNINLNNQFSADADIIYRMNEENQNTISKVKLVEVTENHSDQRLDNFLITQLKGVPKSHIYRIVRKGEVRVNKGRVDVKYRLVIGDIVRIPPMRLPEPGDVVFVKQSLRDALMNGILFEDDGLLILNKPRLCRAWRYRY
jgi:S4 domain